MGYSRNSTIKRSTDNSNSRLVQGGLTDIYSNRLGWWEKRVLARSHDDFVLAVREHEVARPDLIAHRAYGKAVYAWLVLQYNNIVDPETEMATGTVLYLPTQRRLMLDIVTKTVGGHTV